MIEIKFRALYEGLWYYQTLEEIMTITLAAFRKGKYKTQYTGLKDKNGKEIYEGDILCWPKYEGTKHQTRWIIEWNDKCAAWSDYSPREDAKVIGNIYETPELLPL